MEIRHQLDRYFYHDSLRDAVTPIESIIDWLFLHRADGRNIRFLFQVEAPVEHGLRRKPSLLQRLRDGRDLILAPRWHRVNAPLVSRWLGQLVHSPVLYAPFGPLKLELRRDVLSIAPACPGEGAGLREADADLTFDVGEGIVAVIADCGRGPASTSESLWEDVRGPRRHLQGASAVDACVNGRDCHRTITARRSDSSDPWRCADISPSVETRAPAAWSSRTSATRARQREQLAAARPPPL